MKKLLFLGSLVTTVWYHSAYAQTPTGSTAVVRLREASPWHEAIVTYGPGKTEYIDLKIPVGKKNNIANAESIQAIFDKLYGQGYTLQFDYKTGEKDDLTRTFIFRKP